MIKNKLLVNIILLWLLIMTGLSLPSAYGMTKSSDEKTNNSPSTFYTDQKGSLRGLNEISVVVQPLPAELEKEGITAGQIKKDIGERLRQVGIKVIEEEEGERGSEEPEKSFLFINFFPYILQKNVTYGYSLSVYLNQPVLLQHNTKIACLGTTWYSGGIGIIRINKLKTFSQTEVAEHIDKFIENYLAVNPK